MHLRILSLTLVAGLIAGSFWIGAASGQNAAKQAELPHKVGLIDMAQVFKDYKKFDNLREDLKGEFQAAAEEEKRSAEKIQAAQTELNSGVLKQGSPEFIEREQQITKMIAEHNATRANNQKELMRKESKIYHVVYLEAQDAVEKFCKSYKYTMVMRFNREELSTDPQKLMQGLQRQVIYYQLEDDITDSVIDYLNGRYQKATATGGNTAKRQPAAPAAKTAKAPAGTSQN